MKCLAFWTIGLMVFQGMAQQNISGTITNDFGNPIVGANVIVLNSELGSSTDTLGAYQVTLSAESGEFYIQISALGYETIIRELQPNNGANTFNFVLRSVPSELNEVLVTANRRLQDVQRTNASVSAIGQKKIKQLQIDRITELNSVAPNFQTYDDGGTGAFALTSSRVISTIDTENPIVGLYVDESPYFTNFALPLNLNDIAQIEVLRGPQGTLYGRNALAGVIKITSKKPSNTLNGFVNMDVGNLGFQKLAFGLNTPLVKDKLFLRLSSNSSQRDGYIENLFTGENVHDQNVLGMTTRLRYLSSEKLTFDLNYNFQNRQSSAYALISPTTENTLQDIVRNNPYKVNLDTDLNREVTTHNLGVKAKYDFDTFSLSAITTYQQTDQERLDDFDFSPLDIQSSFTDYDFTNISQEVRLVSTSKSKFDWVLGGFAYRNGQDRFDDARNGVDSGQDNAPFSIFDTIELVQKGFALYVQSSYNISESFTITGGLRYDYEKTSVGIERTFSTPDTPGSMFFAEADFNAISPKIALGYQVSKNTFLFSNIARGYRPGGINQFVADLSVAPYEPENTINYEIGLKTTLFNNTMRLNLTGFYIDYTDQQIFTVLNLDNFDFGLDNIGKSRSYGIELETNVLLIPGLNLDMNMGYLNTKVVEFETFDFATNAFIDASGRKLPLSPDFNGNLALTYITPIKNTMAFEVNTNYIYQSEMFFDLPEDLVQEAYGLLNTRIGITSKNLDLFLWGKNITDVAYYSYGFGISGFNAASFALPRTFGASLTAKF